MVVRANNQRTVLVESEPCLSRKTTLSRLELGVRVERERERGEKADFSLSDSGSLGFELPTFVSSHRSAQSALLGLVCVRFQFVAGREHELP